jgi:hypothetical protein
MKQTIFILFLLILVHSANAQQEPKSNLVKPLAIDRLFWLSSPHKPKQTFIVERQEITGGLLKVIYFPKTDGLRGGVTEFVDPKTLTNKTLWNLKLRNPLENEKAYCKVDNYFRTSKGKIHKNEIGEPTLRFRATQIEADIKFNNLLEMPCMILESFLK